LKGSSTTSSTTTRNEHLGKYALFPSEKI
jgi:hypothetical protein